MNRQRIIDSINTFTGWGEPWSSNLADKIIADQGDDSADFRVRRDAPDTSKAIVDKIRSGSLQDDILARFVCRPETGFTDDEMEQETGRTHQSVSACRNTLMRKGYLVDSGDRRKTRSGNDAIVYIWTGKKVMT